MDKVGLPRGLIRYSTENAMAKHYGARDILQHLMRPRTLVYSTILVLIVAAAAWSLATRVPLKVDVLRDRSMLYREADDERIENVFTLRVMNTDEAPHRYQIEVSGIDGLRLESGSTIEVAGASSKTVAAVVSVEEGTGKKGSNPVVFDIRADGAPKIAVHEKTSFYLP